MFQNSLYSLLIVAANLAQMPAQQEVASFEPLREFKGYPRKPMVGSTGHAARDPYFTGRWCCAPISVGTIGEPEKDPVPVPFAFAFGRKIRDERIAAIAVVDTESDARLCLHIKPEFQPRWDTEFHFRILSKDMFCLTARSGDTSAKPHDCNLLTVSLTDKSISVEQMPLSAARRRLWTLAITPHSTRQPFDDGADSQKQTSEPPRWFLGDGTGSFNKLLIFGDHEPERYIGPGSRKGRLTQLEILGSGQFAISERDVDPAGRQYWLLSEATIELLPKERRPDVAKIYFPSMLIAPVERLVFAAASLNGRPTVYSITNGRLSRLWDTPEGYEITRLKLSEDESYAAVELNVDATPNDKTVFASINVTSGEATIFDEPTDGPDLLFLVGVTNRGSLVQNDGMDQLFVRHHGSDKSQRIVGLIRDP